MENVNPYDPPQGPPSASSQPASPKWFTFGAPACAIGLLAIACPIPSLIELASYPLGSSLRPMGAAAAVMLGAAAGCFIVLPLSVACVVHGRRSRVGIAMGCVSIMVAVVAIVLGFYLFNYIVTSRGYELLP
jgi:hypothetical protein